jgi:uncharacterized membrane protein YuzA (DUF378 family)
MKTLDFITLTLVIIGALNWGLVGMADFDLVAAVLGPMSGGSRVVYGLVGLAAVYQALSWKAMQRRWNAVAVRA